MITEALFHDETGLCRSPEEPRAGEPVTLFFRTAKDDVSAVYLVSRDHEMRLCRDKDRRDARFDWYRITLTVPEKLFSYYFEVESGMDMVAYDRTGSVRRPDPQHQFRIRRILLRKRHPRGNDRDRDRDRARGRDGRS